MKKLSLSILIVLALALGVFMVRAQDGGDATPRESYGLQVVQGDGFSFLVPISMVVTPHERLFRLTGPEVIVPSAAFGDNSRSAYHYQIEAMDNPDQLSSEDFARQYVLAQWQQLTADQNPFPVSQDGVIREDKVQVMTVGGYDAFQLLYFGGDRQQAKVFIAHGDLVLIFHYDIMPIENDPLAPVQLDLAYMIMSTLQFDAE